MSLEISKIEIIPANFVIPASELDWNKVISNIVSFINKSHSLFQDTSVDNEDEGISTSTNFVNISERTSIYVCTFCQVFSSKFNDVRDHIATAHNASLPAGTSAEDFISKLQALNNENKKKCPKKTGRPPKKLPENSPIPEEKLPAPDPVPGPDGLYWCQKCKKYFKKPRQLSMHVCLELPKLEDDDALSEEFDEFLESDGSTEFRPYMNVQPTPWSKRPRFTKKETKQLVEQNQLNQISSTSETSIMPKEQTVKTTRNWRDDPAYVRLFGNEKEQRAFEEHLKSIDYSGIDNLFMKEDTKIQGKRKNGSLQSSISVYSCTLCNKVQNSLSHIRMHCLTHTQLKPFTCPKCEYCCNSKGSLYTHMRSHTGNVFRCSHCDFKCAKRTHLLDHEETHSGIPHLCQLCKNSYKTLRSLTAHVKRYHTSSGGKKFLKLLTSKDYKKTIITCNICTKQFISQSIFDAHNRKEHTVTVMPSEVETAVKMMENLPDTPPEDIEIEDPPLVVPPTDATLDPLAEIVLNNLLQQKNTVPIELYEDVFPQSPNSVLIPPTVSLSENIIPDTSSRTISPINNTNQYHAAKDVLAECGKNLNLEILDECLRDSTFGEEVIAKACISPKLPNECQGPFNLPQISLDFTNNALIASKLGKDSESIPKELVQLNTSDLVDKNCMNENKTDEIQLFEKCRRAPAYVCCVCSGIYICPSTLKAHLREHINTTSSLIEQAAQDFAQEKLPENDSELDSMCRILQDPSDVCAADEEELEKLYSSSLDMIWYLPEVSVVLENDPALFDAVLDDISNFPIPD